MLDLSDGQSKPGEGACWPCLGPESLRGRKAALTEDDLIEKVTRPGPGGRQGAGEREETQAPVRDSLFQRATLRAPLATRPSDRVQASSGSFMPTKVQ